jgi:hypothetical protein
VVTAGADGRWRARGTYVDTWWPPIGCVRTSLPQLRFTAVRLLLVVVATVSSTPVWTRRAAAAVHRPPPRGGRQRLVPVLLRVVRAGDDRRDVRAGGETRRAPSATTRGAQNTRDGRDAVEGGASSSRAGRQHRHLSAWEQAGRRTSLAESDTRDRRPRPPPRRNAQVEPGEIVRLDKEGISSFKVWGEAGPPRAPAFCVFEYVYFARPDR